MYPPQKLSRCGDCKLFGSLASKPDCCGWEIPECKGADSVFARKCSLFTFPNGYQPLLDCSEEDLPDWAVPPPKQLCIEV